MNAPNFPKNNITGVILAGGRGSRMGGQDKGLLLLNGKPLVQHVVDTVRPQVGTLLISANRHQSRYEELCQVPVLTDTFGNYDGPLAGMATALTVATTDYVLFVPCDSPYLSSQLAYRLYTSLVQQQALLSVANDGTRLHHVITLLTRELLPSLLKFLANGERKIGFWYAQLPMARADFTDMPQTLLNINTLDQLASLK
jgi:molybdenum cofactor guanylyltransferase